MKCSLPVRNTQIFVSAFYNLAIFKKLSTLTYFAYLFSIACFFGIIYQNIRKDSFKSEVSKHFKMLPTVDKTLGHPPKKEGNKDGPV